jgi:hypothetical protein
MHDRAAWLAAVLEAEERSEVSRSHAGFLARSCFLYLCQWSFTDGSGPCREPDIRMIVEMVLGVACTDRLR